MDNQWKGRALGTILSESSMITPGDIERALEEQKRSGLRIGDALIKLGIVTKDDVNWGLSHQLNIPFVRLQPDVIDPEAVRLVPGETARRHRLVPYLLIGDELTIVVEDPTNRRAVEEVERLTGKHLIVGVGLPDEITASLEQIYEGKSGAVGRPDLTSELFASERVTELAADSSGRLLVDALLQTAIEQDADGVDFLPLPDRVEVFFRHDEKSRPAATLSLSWMHVIARQIKQLIHPRAEQSDTFTGLLPFRHHDREIHFQTTILRATGGDAISLSRPEAPSLAPRIEENLRHEALAGVWSRLLQPSTGLFVLAGSDPAARWSLTHRLFDAKHIPGRKAVFLGRSLVFTDSALVRIQPRDGSVGAWQNALESVLAYRPALLIVEDLTHEGVLNAVTRLALDGTLVLGIAPLPGATAAVEFLLEKTDSRVLLAEALLGVLCPHRLPLLAADRSLPEERRDLARRLFDFTDAELRAASLRRAGEPLASAGGDSLMQLSLFARADLPAGLLKSPAPASEIAAAVRETLRRQIAACLRVPVAAGQIALDDVLTILGGESHGAA